MKSRIAALAAALVLLAACAAEDEGDTAPAAVTTTTARPDETTFDVKWKDRTVVVAEDVTARTFLREESSPDEGRYAFKTDPALEGIAKGAIVVLPKIGLYKITELEKKADRIVLTTEPASMLEAASEGTLRWNIDASAHEAVALTKKKGQGSVATKALAPLTTNRPVQDGASIDMQLGGEIDGADYTMNVKMSRSEGEGRTSLDFDVVGAIEQEKGGAAISASSSFKGRVAFRSDGVYSFKDGETKQFEFHVRDVDLDVTAAFEVKGMTVQGELVDYPARIIVPFALGPVPMYLAFGAAVEIQAELRTNESIKVEGNVKYKGDVGIAGKGLSITKADASGTPELSGKAELDVGFAAGIKAMAAGPRIELGMGLPQLGKFGPSAGVYADLRGAVGAFASASVSTGGRPCIQGIGELGVFYGGEAKFFGLKIGAEKPILQRRRRFYERDPGSCPPLEEG